MPAKRKTAETESPNDNPDKIAPGRPEAPTPSAQPAPTKRQRVSRACDQCRAAREKCDGIQPECLPCVSQSRPCTYQVSPRKRGVQTGYIRTLELALGWVFEKVPASEEALSTLVSDEGGRGQTILGGKDLGADRLHKKWRRSRVHKGIDRILSGGGVPSPSQDGRAPPEDVSDGEGDEARSCSQPQSADASANTVTQESPNLRCASVSHGPPTVGSSDVGRQPETPMRHIPRAYPPSPRRLKLPPNHWRLLDIYFSYTHSWLPILEKQDSFQASYLYPEDGLVVNPEEASSAVHAELWAALALASLQDAASARPSSDNADPVGPCPAEIYEIARGLVPLENGPFQVHHARALLLLSLVNLGQDRLTGAWLLTGSAIRILLDADTTQSCRQDKEQQRMTPALMSCFMIDTILSVRCNKPPHLRAEDIADLPPVPEDGLDQWEPWAPCDGFGGSHTASRSSRSPAFCMSTFNQLYAIIRTVASEMPVKRRGSSPRDSVEASITQLKRAINHNSPLGSFITSPSCGTSSVPTAYIARVTYLWACALSDPRTESFLPLLIDTLDQYQRLFGKCGMPPFITACIASITDQGHLLGRGEEQRERLRGLVTAYSPASDGTRRLSQVVSPNIMSQPTQQLPITASTSQFPAEGNPNIPYSTPIIASLYNNSPSTTQHTQPNPSNRVYGPFATSGLTTPYQPPFTNPSAPPMPQRNNSINMHMGPPITSIPGAPTAVAPTRHDRHHPFLPPPGFGAGPDYEALLDDLASIECTDAVDVDPQFMTNLGFAPGCDIAEIFTRDFGGA